VGSHFLPELVPAIAAFAVNRPAVCKRTAIATESISRGKTGDYFMRREYVEDAVLVLSGAVVIAGAWILHWQAGLIVAGLVCMLLAVLAYRHRESHKPREPSPPPESMGAAAWRFPSQGTKHSSGAQHRNNIHSL
jgi:hypothetical protein